MPALQIGAMLAPTAISAGANLFRSNNKSPYEQQLSRYAQMFDEQGSMPVTENREFKSGMKAVNAADDRNRTAINNQSATAGATDEAKIATMQGANQSRDQNIDRLLNNARRYRSLMQNKAMQTSGMLEQQRQFRNDQFQGKLGSIINPLSQATNAFVLSDMFESPQQPGQPQGIADASGPMNTSRVNAMNQAFSKGVWG